MLLDVRAGFVLVPFEVAEANRSHFASLGARRRAGESCALLASAFLGIGGMRANTLLQPCESVQNHCVFVTPRT